MKSVRVWDLPTRLFHWALVVCFVGLLVTGEQGDSAMVWHFRFGYSVLTLLLFRLTWGFVGGYWSRFSAFVVGPRTIWRYINGQSEHRAAVGHNPLGSLSVLALLGFALLQVASGLFSDDEIATVGPLAKAASSGFVSLATFYHAKVGKVVLIVLVQLHIAAIIFYRVRSKENLVLPMLSGDKQLPDSCASARDDGQSRLLALGLLVVCAVAVFGLVQWAS